MIWLLAIPVLLALAALLTVWANRALYTPPEDEQPCEHPWYMDGRCVVCGEPR
jgi:hypothetical protein